MNESAPIEDSNTPQEAQLCGVVMPIAAMPDYSESHWVDVLDILKDSVASAGLTANLVSYTEEASLIHTTIVQNLYDNPIVVCDVSGKNPNVMFELGLRLAFDRPTIIVKDDKTGYSFDTGSIEHLTYPRDLRFSKIVDFKLRLADKIKATLQRAQADPNYSTFLKHFKRVTVAKLEEREVSSQEFVIEELRSMKRLIQRLERNERSNSLHEDGLTTHNARRVSIFVGDMDSDKLEEFQMKLKNYSFIKSIRLNSLAGKSTIDLEFLEPVPGWVIDDIFSLRKSLVEANN